MEQRVRKIQRIKKYTKGQVIIANSSEFLTNHVEGIASTLFKYLTSTLEEQVFATNLSEYSTESR